MKSPHPAKEIMKYTSEQLITIAIFHYLLLLHKWLGTSRLWTKWLKKDGIDTGFHRPEEDKLLKEICRRMAWKLATGIQENAGLDTRNIGKWGSSLLGCEEDDTIRYSLGSRQRILAGNGTCRGISWHHKMRKSWKLYILCPFTQKTHSKNNFSRFMGLLTAIHRHQWTIPATIESSRWRTGPTRSASMGKPRWL